MAIAAGGATTQVTNSRTWAIGWLAAARAQNGSRSPVYRSAALAGAVRQILITLTPTPPAYALATQYGNRVARPFALRSAGQYRPAPPALGSPRYERDIAEVKAYGAVDSTVRTQA
ncbi:hypothetical protein [Actinoplanes utahensis]|uniref:Uncharacterized protein n=1 Tax=Actinoplanes utahensis TaxID=1869 RepID=A0A0A6UCU4_ACTUT|nr:hypothetical protein [Actinoplanes utahensis]KHD73855.1 hypothetical protein MB27_33040 [Actinoplanes utahensis]GIF27752.1 hypothetical protein Aut01nite_07380 [Actinoplanes utahensis]